MTKAELIAAIAEQAGVTKAQAEDVLNAVTNAVIPQALAAGESIQLIGFGTFEVRERAARTGRNPKTGETIQIPASKTVGFKAGKKLKDAVEA